MLDKVEVLKNNGEKVMYDEISMFEVSINGTPKKYAVLTSNELDPNGLTKLLVAEISGNRLTRITDDTEWSVIKNVLRSIISSSSYDFNYINIEGKFEMAGDIFRVIAVQEAAKTQLISDFAAKKPSQATIDSQQQNKQNEANTVQEPAIDPSIYPTSTPNAALGSEIIPGIMEANSDLVNVTPPDAGQLEEINVSESSNNSNNIVNDIPNGDTPAIDISGFSDVSTPTIENSSEPTTVQHEVPANNVITPENTVINQNISTTESNNDAKNILVNRILEAVDEYIKNTSTPSTNNSEEVENLKKQLKEMETKLQNIMSLIGS